jgi:hypothetical protein
MWIARLAVSCARTVRAVRQVEQLLVGPAIPSPTWMRAEPDPDLARAGCGCGPSRMRSAQLARHLLRSAPVASAVRPGSGSHPHPSRDHCGASACVPGRRALHGDLRPWSLWSEVLRLARWALHGDLRSWSLLDRGAATYRVSVPWRSRCPARDSARSSCPRKPSPGHCARGTSRGRGGLPGAAM